MEKIEKEKASLCLDDANRRKMLIFLSERQDIPMKDARMVLPNSERIIPEFEFYGFIDIHLAGNGNSKIINLTDAGRQLAKKCQEIEEVHRTLKYIEFIEERII